MSRGSAPGERRGGRKPGVKNRPTILVEEKLRKLRCDPIAGMVRIARAKDTPVELKGRMFAELSQYIYPKRKATEVSGTLSFLTLEIVKAIDLSNFSDAELAAIKAGALTNDLIARLTRQAQAIENGQRGSGQPESTGVTAT